MQRLAVCCGQTARRTFHHQVVARRLRPRRRYFQLPSIEMLVLTMSTVQSSTAQVDHQSLLNQHNEYCDALRAAGLELIWADQIDEPDAVFVEDTAVAFGKPDAPTTFLQLPH